MKNLIIIAFALFAYSNSMLANGNNPASLISNNVENQKLIVVAKTTVYGKNQGTTVTTVTDTDGGSTTVVDIDCDNFFDDTCYTVESAAADTKILVPAEGKSFKGLLIDSNPKENIYKLFNM